MSNASDAADNSQVSAEDFLDLRSIRWLERVATPTLQLLAGQLDRFVARRGALLQAGEDPIRRVLLVREGALRVRFGGVTQQATAEQPRALLHALAGHDAGVEIRATTDSELFAINWDDMWEALEEDFTLLTYAIELLASSLPSEDVEAERGKSNASVTFDWNTDRVRQILWLRDTRAFSGAPVHAVGTLAKRAEPESLRSNHVIWRAGDVASFLCVVLSGTLLESGSIARAGAVLGEREALAGRLRASTCTALEASVILRLDTEMIWDVVEDDFGLARYLLRRLARSVLKLPELALTHLPT